MASTATYDLRFGEAVTTTDLNGNVTARWLDAFGRLERLAAPDDSQAAPTVAIRYGLSPGVAWARTKNRLRRAEGDTRGTVDTVVLMDGLGRVIQTKKTAEIATSSTGKGLGWSITGHQAFDAMGRVELQGQTFGRFSQRPEYVPGTPRNPTRFFYDPLGRMIETVEPNGAITRVGYGFGKHAQSSLQRFKTVTVDAEGHAKAAHKDAGDRIVAVGHRTLGGATQVETYLSSMLYDEFGQRVRMVLGNGVASGYTYEPLTRRLARLETRTPSGRVLQGIAYGYDRVGNILTMVNGIGEPEGDRSGTVSFQYRYDDLYRLTWAAGEAKARAHTIDRYTAQYAYSDIHNMTSNAQIHEIVHGGGAGVTAERPPLTNHDFAYAYANPAPHQATRIGETLLVYDKNGNTVRECRDHG